MKKNSNMIIVGKPRRKFGSRLIYIIFLLYQLLWGYQIGISFDLIFKVTKIMADVQISKVMVPVCMLIMLYLYISVCVRCNASWSVDETFFCYNDDSSLNLMQKLKAMAEIFKKGYFTANSHHYKYEEISYVKLYYRERISFMADLSTTQYFKIYFEDGSVLDAPFKLDGDGPKIYEAFQKMKDHGVYLEDPYDLLTLLKHNELLDLRGSKK